MHQCYSKHIVHANFLNGWSSYCLELAIIRIQFANIRWLPYSNDIQTYMSYANSQSFRELRLNLVSL